MVIVGDSGSFSDSGDSGSLIVRRTGNRATGLLFCVGRLCTRSPTTIGKVLTALGVTLAV